MTSPFGRIWFVRSTGALALGLSAMFAVLGLFGGLFLGQRWWLAYVGAVLGVIAGALCFKRGVAEVGAPSYLRAATRRRPAAEADRAEVRRARLVVAGMAVLAAATLAAAISVGVASGSVEPLKRIKDVAWTGALGWWILAAVRAGKQQPPVASQNLPPAERSR